MICYFFILLLIPICLANGQEQLNPSLMIYEKDIQYWNFKHQDEDTKIKLDAPHSISWQISLLNNLVYDDDTDTIIRFYDENNENKFIEIGMGGNEKNKFWVGVWLPEHQYLIPYKKLNRGWFEDKNIIITYSERSGLTVNNGERIVLSNLDIGKFSILYYDLSATSNNSVTNVKSGSMKLEIMSGDPAKNQFHLFPFYLVGSIGCMMVLLLLIKKRS